MPELPEVEHVRRTLEPRLIGRTVTRVRLARRDVVARPTDPPGGFSRSAESPVTKAVPPRELLSRQRIAAITRRGKQLALVADSGRVLCVHLGMSGALRHTADPIGDLDHVHCTWTLDDRSTLLFRDPRRFGGLWTFPSPEALQATRWSLLGPDALTITARALHERLAGTSRILKAALLDQTLLAGVGNIYADEALFDARLHPTRCADSIDRAEATRLARAIRDVLTSAIRAGGSTVRSYTDSTGSPGSYQSRHNVYGRAGLPCTSCATPLESAPLAQRTTVWCPACQGKNQDPGYPHPVPTKPEIRSRKGSLSLYEEKV